MRTLKIDARRTGSSLPFFAITAVLAASLALLGAGCGGDDDDSGAAGTTTGAQAEKYTIGVVLFSAADTSSMTMVDPFVADAQQAGHTVEKVDSEGAPDKAIAGIQAFVTKKVDVIFMPVWEPTFVERRSQHVARFAIRRTHRQPGETR